MTTKTAARQAALARALRQKIASQAIAAAKEDLAYEIGRCREAIATRKTVRLSERAVATPGMARVALDVYNDFLGTLREWGGLS